MKCVTQVAAATVMLLLAALPAAAQDQLLDTSRHDSSLPIAIEADSMEVEQAAQRATFVGAVDVKQGDLTLTAERLVVHYRDKQAESDNTIYLIEVEGFVSPEDVSVKQLEAADAVHAVFVIGAYGVGAMNAAETGS